MTGGSALHEGRLDPAQGAARQERAGVTGRPEVTFWRHLDTGDDIGSRLNGTFPAVPE
jgi:hypothetical protein